MAIVRRNLADDVYDGVFEDLVIVDMDKEDEVIYMNKLQGWELVLKRSSTGGTRSLIGLSPIYSIE